ncbi:hypothetical protein PgNI_10582 [Pyricularia grisea]|uniref:Uncharacterized protein n=1 Tax=Pyricularia grisea TaxID=148305 RepID=A0A6P8AY57_PYRGI|nr:hypothetical protein PgNI_10582 [Pyricularia grisea]TLD07224.1 hypothetical protein PgNI_10582 [Pyricularia grisea]
MANPPTSETLPLGQHVSTSDAEFKLDLTTANLPTIELEDLMINSRAPSTTSSGYLATDSGSNEMPSTAVTYEKSRSHASPSGSSLRGSQNGESSRRQSWMSTGSSTGSQGSLRGDPRLRMVIRQRRESQNLRELGEFLRSKTPPPSNYMSRDNDPTPASPLSDLAKKNKKFSFKAVLARKPARESKGKQIAQPLQPIKLPDTAVAGRTAAGHRHIAISIPVEHSHLGPEIKSQYPIFERQDAPASLNAIESYYMEQDEPLTGNVLGPVPEVSGESDENEPDLINTSQASSLSSPCTPHTAAESQSDFSAVSPKVLGATDHEDRFPSSDFYRPSLSSDYPLESWARSETPLSELFVTAPNSLKSVPSSPFETNFSQRSGVHSKDFGARALSVKKKGFAARHRRENPLREMENAWDADGGLDATAPQPAADESTSNQSAAHWQLELDLDSPPNSAVYTPPEHPEDIINDDHAFEPAWERGRRLYNSHDLVKRTDALGEMIPGSPTSQRTITPQQSIDDVFNRSISPMEVSLRDQDSGLGISTVYSKQSSSRKALTPIRTTNFGMGKEGAAEAAAADRDGECASATSEFPLRKEFRMSQVLEPGQSTPTPWSANLEKQALRMERDVDSLLSPPPEDMLSAWSDDTPLSAAQKEPTPPNSPEDLVEQALDKETQQSPTEHKLKPRPQQSAETPTTRALPQQDRISLTRRIERRKKLAAAAAGARQASLFASIAEVEAKAKALKEQDASNKSRRNSLADPMASQVAPSEFSRSTTDSESADQRVAEMERRVRQLEQQLEQSGEAWMGALMPLLTTLNKTLEGQRAQQQQQQQEMAAENLRRQRRRSSASEFGFSWGRYDESAEEPPASLRRNSMQRYLPEDDDEDERLFISRKGLSPAPSRQYRVITPMEDEENDGPTQAAMQRMRGMRRRSLGSTSTGTFYGHSRKASTMSQDFEEDYDCGPRRLFGGEPHWQGFDRDRFSQPQPATRHWRFPSTSTIGTESVASGAWSSAHGARRQQQPQSQQEGKSSRRVSFASSMDFDPSREDKKKKKSRRRESVGGTMDMGKKVHDLYGLGALMNELRDAARVSQEFLPESATMAGDD